MDDGSASQIPCCSIEAGCRRLEARRKLVIDAARQMFIEQGFHKAGIAQIAASSGVKVGQIYRDFAGKDDIVALIVQADLAALLNEKALMEVIKEGDPEAARAWISNLVLRKSEHDAAPLLLEILAEATRNERVVALLRDSDARIRDCMVSALAVIPGRWGSDAVETADLLFTLMLGLSCRRARLLMFCPPDLLHAQHMIDRVLVERGIGDAAASSY